MRQEFEKAARNQPIDFDELTVLMNKLQFFFDGRCDSQKLVWISQLVVKNSGKLMKHCLNDKSFTFCLAQFLHLTLDFLCLQFASTVTVRAESKEPSGSHWRVLEIFVNLANWRQNLGASSADSALGLIFGVLVKKGEQHCTFLPACRVSVKSLQRCR